MGSKPVAIITGGASGMGLGAAEHLVNSGWNVAIFDFDGTSAAQVAQRLGDDVISIQGNAAVYTDQVKVFTGAWEKWKRIDLVYANVGFGDRMDFCKPVEELENGAPPQPDILTVDVSLVSSIWSAYLAMHFFRKNPSKGGNLVFTSSSAGIYPSSEMVLYGASKHGVVGLTRGLGKRFREKQDPIMVNAICPGLVPTPLISNELRTAVPPEVLTPVSTVVCALKRIVSGDFGNGEIIECSGTEIQVRPPLEYLNEAAEYIGMGKFKGLVDPSVFSAHAEKRGKRLVGMEGKKW